MLTVNTHKWVNVMMMMMVLILPILVHSYFSSHGMMRIPWGLLFLSSSINMTTIPPIMTSTQSPYHRFASFVGIKLYYQLQRQGRGMRLTLDGQQQSRNLGGEGGRTNAKPWKSVTWNRGGKLRANIYSCSWCNSISATYPHKIMVLTFWPQGVS